MFDRFLKSVLMDPEPNPAGGDPGAGADPKPGAFDPAAFKAEIVGEFNKTLNGFAKTMKNDISKLFTPPKPADPTPEPEPKPGDPKPADPEKNALMLEIRNLRVSSEARIKALEQSNSENQQKVEKTDRESKIRTELSKYPFASDSARETAFRLFSSDVSRSEDGTLVANDLPFDKYIETELPAKHSYLLAPKDVGSAGARSGKTAGGANKWTFDHLKPEVFSKLTPAEQAEVRRFVAQANNF